MKEFTAEIASIKENNDKYSIQLFWRKLKNNYNYCAANREFHMICVTIIDSRRLVADHISFCETLLKEKNDLKEVCQQKYNLQS